jgi:hypothetical protein
MAKTIGVVGVPAFAARTAAAPPVATITFTRVWISSATNRGSRAGLLSPKRYSMATVRPSK